jgi:hypothetical protein
MSRLLDARLHWLYCTYVVHPDASSCCSTSRRSVALALIMRPVTPSRGSTTCRTIAPALLRLCRASGRAISLLDFSSAGCTGSRCAPDHCISRLDYSSSGCTGSTAPMSCIRTRGETVTLALAVRPITVSRGLTTCHLVASALLRLCCASGRAVSPFDNSTLVASTVCPGSKS